jgi:hypothetical protein
MPLSRREARGRHRAACRTGFVSVTVDKPPGGGDAKELASRDNLVITNRLAEKRDRKTGDVKAFDPLRYTLKLG